MLAEGAELVVRDAADADAAATEVEDATISTQVAASAAEDGASG